MTTLQLAGRSGTGRTGGDANRLRRAALIALPAVLLAGAACSGNGGGDESSSSTTPASLSTSSEPSTTTVPFLKENIVLSANGLGGELVFGGANAARTINLLRQALGEPEKNQQLPAQSTCQATRRLQWASLQVLVNEVTSVSGAGRPGFAGWFLGAPSATTHDLKTDKGIGVGSTVASMKAAYAADFSMNRGESGPGFNITLSNGIILGQLDVLTDAGKVRTIQAGNYCGPG